MVFWAFPKQISTLKIENLTENWQMGMRNWVLGKDNVILVTGYSKKRSDESASEIGIKAFIYKPIVKADLLKTVRKVLDNTNNET